MDALEIIEILQKNKQGPELAKFSFSTNTGRVYSFVPGSDGKIRIIRDSLRGWKAIIGREKTTGKIENIPLHEIIEIVGLKGPIKVN